MGNSIVPVGEQSSYILSGKRKMQESYNTRVALWQLPYNEDYLKYDDDGNRWFDSVNKWGQNELSQAEDALNMSFNKYKVHTKTTVYNDDTYDIESKYPNQNVVYEKHRENHVWSWIKDKYNKLVAEKIYNRDSEVGRKTVYRNINNGGDTFTIVNVYSYNTSKNRATDIVNYGYTSDEKAFTKGCNPISEYYMLNGKQVSAEKTDTGEYKVNSNDGKIITFLVE